MKYLAKLYWMYVAIQMPFGLWLMEQPTWKRVVAGLPVAIITLPFIPLIVVGAMCAIYLQLRD